MNKNRVGNMISEGDEAINLDASRYKLYVLVIFQIKCRFLKFSMFYTLICNRCLYGTKGCWGDCYITRSCELLLKLRHFFLVMSDI